MVNIKIFRTDPPQVTSLKKKSIMHFYMCTNNNHHAAEDLGCEHETMQNKTPVWVQSHLAGRGPVCWGPGPAEATPGRGCSAAGQSGNPGGKASGREGGWCTSDEKCKQRCSVASQNIVITEWTYWPYVQHSSCESPEELQKTGF